MEKMRQLREGVLDAFKIGVSRTKEEWKWMRV